MNQPRNRPFAQSAEENKQAILQALRPCLKGSESPCLSLVNTWVTLQCLLIDFEQGRCLRRSRTRNQAKDNK